MHLLRAFRGSDRGRMSFQKERSPADTLLLGPLSLRTIRELICVKSQSLQLFFTVAGLLQVGDGARPRNSLCDSVGGLSGWGMRMDVVHSLQTTGGLGLS